MIDSLITLRTCRWLLLLLLISGCTAQSETPNAANSTSTDDSLRTASDPIVRVVSTNVPAIFEAPILLVTAAGPISVEQPGYASPCWADVDGDGTDDLLVGQFSGGKIRVYKNLGDLNFADGQWLEAGGDVAEVPGVW